MSELDKAIAAAREALAKYWNGDEMSGIGAAVDDLLAALNAARGEAVAWRFQLGEDWWGVTTYEDDALSRLAHGGIVQPLFALGGEIRKSSGNVFSDIGFSDDEAAELLKKANACIPPKRDITLSPVAVPAPPAEPDDGPDLEIRNPYRPSESWHIKAAAIGLKVSREALDHTARLLELSDHHLTNGPFPIDRGKTYWRAQAAVAIGAVNELAAKAEQGKESGNG